MIVIDRNIFADDSGLKLSFARQKPKLLSDIGTRDLALHKEGSRWQLSINALKGNGLINAWTGNSVFTPSTSQTWKLIKSTKTTSGVHWFWTSQKPLIRSWIENPYISYLCSFFFWKQDFPRGNLNRFIIKYFNYLWRTTESSLDPGTI